MTRRKVKLAFIVNDNARKASLKKRRAGLAKKMNDLSILCDVRGCLIVYNPEEEEPLVWPSPQIACGLIDRFFSLPEIERKKKSVNQESFLKDRLEKLNEMLVKTQKKNREIRMARLLYQIHGGGGRSINHLAIKEMYGLTWFSREKIGELQKRLDFIRHIPNQRPPSQNADADFSGDQLGAAARDLRDLHIMEQRFQINRNIGDPTVVGNSQYNNRGLAFPYEGLPGAQLNVNANVERFLQAQANVHPNVDRFLEGQANANPNLERFLGSPANANPNVDMSFTNLVLGILPGQPQDINSSTGLRLGLAPQYDLAGGSFGQQNRYGADGGSSFGQQNRYGADGGSSFEPLNGQGADGGYSNFGPPNHYGADAGRTSGGIGGNGGVGVGGGELGPQFGLSGEVAGDMGMHYDVNNSWPNNNNFNM